MRTALLSVLFAITAAAADSPVMPYGFQPVSRTDYQTTGDLHLYVDPAGSDGNDCLTVPTACRTYNGAFYKIPSTVRHHVTVTGSAGSLVGGFLAGKTIVNDTSSTTAGITVEGTLVTATAATGTATGTVTAIGAPSGITRATMTDSLQTWTSNDFKGKLICATSGTANGACGVIVSNTDTAITYMNMVGVTSWSSTFNFSVGNTYVVRDWGTTMATPTFSIPGSLISASSTSATHFYVVDNYGGNLGSAGTTIFGPGLIEFRAFKFTNSVTVRANGNTGGVSFYWNSVTGSASGGIVTAKNNAPVMVQASYWSTTGSGAVSTAGPSGPWFVKNNYADACGSFVSANSGANFGSGGLDNNEIECTSGVVGGQGFTMDQGGSGNHINCESRASSFGIAVQANSSNDLVNQAWVDFSGSIAIDNCVTAVRAVGSSAGINIGTISGSGNTTCFDVRYGAQAIVGTNSLSGCTTEVTLDNGFKTYTAAETTAGVYVPLTGTRYGNFNTGAPHAVYVGRVLVPTKYGGSGIPTCSLKYLGASFVTLGGDGEGEAKECQCTSDGAATAVYKWCSTTLQTKVTTCTGNTTTCN